MSPLWSVIGECQSCECALMSPAINEFGMLVSRVSSVVRLASSDCWLVV